jgi:hypothetical protein
MKKATWCTTPKAPESILPWYKRRGFPPVANRWCESFIVDAKSHFGIKCLQLSIKKWNRCPGGCFSEQLCAKAPSSGSSSEVLFAIIFRRRSRSQKKRCQRTSSLITGYHDRSCTTRPSLFNAKKGGSRLVPIPLNLLPRTLIVVQWLCNHVLVITQISNSKSSHSRRVAPRQKNESSR